MTTETTPDFILNGILTCGQCTARMALTSDETSAQLYFTCSPQDRNAFNKCLAPTLDAHRLDRLVVEKVMETVLTRKHLNILIAKTDQLLAEKLGKLENSSLADEAGLYTRGQLREMTTSHTFLVQAAGGPQQVRELLKKFIEDVRITLGNAAVHYKIPLPPDPPQAGKRVQHIPLPVGTLVNRLPVIF